MRKLSTILLLGTLAMTGCGDGAADDGGGGTGGSGLEGDEECVRAVESINADPCASDADVDVDLWEIPLVGCMDENETKLCVNCLYFNRNDELCPLNNDCISECAPLHP